MHALRVEHQIGERQREQLAHFLQRPVGAHFAEARDQLIGATCVAVASSCILGEIASTIFVRSARGCAAAHCATALRSHAGLVCSIRTSTEGCQPRCIATGLTGVGAGWRALVWPSTCVLCGRAGQRDLDLCAACEADLPRNDPACARLRGAAGRSQASRRCVCGGCLRRAAARSMQRVVPFRYAYPLDHLVQRPEVSAVTSRAVACSANCLAPAHARQPRANRCRSCSFRCRSRRVAIASAATTRRASSRCASLDVDRHVAARRARRCGSAKRRNRPGSIARRAAQNVRGAFAAVATAATRATSRSSMTSSRPAARSMSSHAVLQQGRREASRSLGGCASKGRCSA